MIMVLLPILGTCVDHRRLLWGGGALVHMEWLILCQPIFFWFNIHVRIEKICFAFSHKCRDKSYKNVFHTEKLHHMLSYPDHRGRTIFLRVSSARWHARTNLTPSMYCVHIWLRVRQIGFFTWVEPYKSNSGQFCLSYNHIKFELKHFFQLIFDHNYLFLYV